MSDYHFKKECTGCKTIVAQCRCPSKEKTVIPVLCEKCKPKDTE